jgi:D-serine deaminase-like pyridoxal phosphate-dependent protein
MNVLFPDLDTPEVLLDLTATEHNVARMAGIARAANLNLRRHTKTHKSPEITKLQINAGAAGITVAKQDVLVCSCAEEGIFLLYHTLLGAGDHAIIETRARR